MFSFNLNIGICIFGTIIILNSTIGHLMCAYALLIKAAMCGWVKVQCVGNGRTLFDIKFEQRF